MTDQIKRLRELMEKATPGARMRPISMRGEALLELGDPYNRPASSRSIQLPEADAAFIVAMRNALPALLAVAEALQETQEWLHDPRQGTWPYVENGVMFEDMEKLKRKIGDALANLEKLP